MLNSCSDLSHEKDQMPNCGHVEKSLLNIGMLPRSVLLRFQADRHD